MNQNDTKVIDMVIDIRDSHLWIRKCLKYLKHLKYLKYIPSTTKCLRSPLGINSRVLEWGSRAILDSRPLVLLWYFIYAYIIIYIYTYIIYVHVASSTSCEVPIAIVDSFDL